MATVQEAAVLKSAIKKFFGSPAARVEVERATQALNSGVRPAQGAGSPAMRLDAAFRASSAELGRPGMATLAASPSAASSSKQLTAGHGVSKPLAGHKFPVLPGQAFIPSMVASTLNTNSL